MIAPDVVAAFIERQHRERAAAGLPETITDPEVLRLVAAIIARPEAVEAWLDAQTRGGVA